MNFVLLTEGTGQGLTERSNVSRLAASLARDGAQRVNLEHGCGSRHEIFGRLEPVKRVLDGIRRHAACAKVVFDLI